MPRPDDLARGGGGRRCLAAARRKPYDLARLITESGLEPIISADLRLIAKAAIVANLESGAESKAVTGAEPDADAASLRHPVRIANAVSREHLCAWRRDRHLFGNQLVSERGLHAESAGDIPLLRGQFLDALADMDGHGPVQRDCVDQREDGRVAPIPD